MLTTAALLLLALDAPATTPSPALPAASTREAVVDAPTTDAAVVAGGGKLFTAASPEARVRVTREVFPAVVRLDVAQETYEDGKRTLQRGIGSGVIIDDLGHVLTNYHVAGRGSDIFVTLYNRERVKATLVGDDHWTDLAIVRIDMDEVRRKNLDVRHAPLGDSDGLVPGQDVFAIGTPFGLTRTATLGIVSNTERTFYPENITIDDYETGWFGNWIQTDATIAPGNSGGPLVDLDGRVVGINTRGNTRGFGLNFAIPIDLAKKVAAELLRTATAEEKGRVVRADLGVEFKPLQDLESFYELDPNKGALISAVDRAGPAAEAGLRPQDILLALAGAATNVRFPEEIAALKARIAALPIGEPVEMLVRRGGEEVKLTAKPAKLESAVGEEREFKTWGVSVRDVTRRLANERQLDDADGVVVTSVNRGFPAERADLEQGDVIRSVDRKPVVDLEAFAKLYRELEDKDAVLLGYVRNRGVRSAVLRND